MDASKHNQDLPKKQQHGGSQCVPRSYVRSSKRKMGDPSFLDFPSTEALEGSFAIKMSIAHQE